MMPARLSKLFYLAFLGMELSYLYLLASLLDGPLYSLILSLMLYPLALLNKLALPWPALPQRLRFPLELALVILVILLVAGERLFSSLATGQVDVLGIILSMGFCGLTWLLGHTVPHKQLNYPAIAFRLQIGLLVLLVFSQIAGSAPPVFIFFLLAPLALFLARWANSFSRGATALSSPNARHLFLAGANVMVPGVALILLLSPNVARSIVDWLKNIFLSFSNWADAQHRAAANPPGDFRFDFSCSIAEEQYAPPSTSMPPPSTEGAGGMNPVVIWIIVFVVLAAIVALVAFTLRRRKAEHRSHQTGEPVQFQLRMLSLDMLRNLLYLLPQLLKKLWLWLISLWQRRRSRPKSSQEPLISIRALYRNLLSWAARQGASRIPSQTPLEYLELLEHRFPQQQDDLKLVTESYLLARYSQQPVSQEHFETVKKAWQRATAYNNPSQFKM
jgi:hypothetical protein